MCTQAEPHGSCLLARGILVFSTEVRGRLSASFTRECLVPAWCQTLYSALAILKVSSHHKPLNSPITVTLFCYCSTEEEKETHKASITSARSG